MKVRWPYFQRISCYLLCSTQVCAQPGYWETQNTSLTTVTPSLVIPYPQICISVRRLHSSKREFKCFRSFKKGTKYYLRNKQCRHVGQKADVLLFFKKNRRSEFVEVFYTLQVYLHALCVKLVYKFCPSVSSVQDFLN